MVLHDLMQSAMAKAIFIFGMALICAGLMSLLVNLLSRASLPDETMEEFDPVTIAINLMRSVGGKYNKQHEETIFL